MQDPVSYEKNQMTLNGWIGDVYAPLKVTGY